MPKVSPPVSSSGLRQTGNVLDKIQAELAETKRREDELRRQRRGVTRSQPDLSNLGTRESEAETGDTEGAESGEEVSHCTHCTDKLYTCTLYRRRRPRAWSAPGASPPSSPSGRTGSSARRRPEA